MIPERTFHLLESDFTDPARLRQERAKARKLKKSHWWQMQVNRGICHYCGKKFPPSELTMDHVVPLARGGTSSKGNLVPACRECNRDKKLDIPAEKILEELG